MVEQDPNEEDRNIKFLALSIQSITVSKNVDKLTEGGEENTQKYAPPKCILYTCLFIFFLVNFFEGIIMDVAQEKDVTSGARCRTYTKFLVALPYFFDSIGRTLVGFQLLENKTTALAPLQQLSFGQWRKLLITRCLCHCGCILETAAKSYTSSATVTVVTQLRIPLVALLRYCFVYYRLNRNQLFFVYAIIFTAIGWDSEKVWEQYAQSEPSGGFVFGIALTIVSVFLMSCFYVLLEDILKQDLKQYPVWNKQFVLGLVDIPIMGVLLFVFVAFERELVGVDRSWNPFTSAMNPYVGMLTVNNVVWRLVGYCILNWADALWLNLGAVLVVAALWIFEVWLNVSEFNITKVFSLLTLVSVCVGYEFETNAREDEVTAEKKVVPIVGDKETSRL